MNSYKPPETRITNITTPSALDEANRECCLVQIHGPDLGKKHVLGKLETTIGRDERADIDVDLDNVSRRHARIFARSDRMFVEDLQSKNGTRLNDQEVSEPQPLRSGDLLKIGGAIFKFLHGANIETQYHETIYTLTIKDSLTGVSNKRYFLEYLEREMGRSHRYQRALSMMLLDIDHFKRINDERGHLAGDHVLRELAQSINRLVRREQCFARYGGEEFALVMPEDEPEKVRRVAETVRKFIEEKSFIFEDGEIPVTVSIGLADMTPDMTEPTQFIKAVDAYLYKAKKGGRNRVVAAPMPGADRPTSSKSKPGSPEASKRSPQPVREPRRPIDGMALVHRNLARSPPGPVLAFEVTDERTIIDLLSAEAFEKWTFELGEEVEKAIGPADLLGSWRDRYILVALEAKGHEARTRSVIDALRNSWATRPVPEAVRGRLTRSLRTAVLSPDSVVAMGERCLDRLAVHLLDDAGRTSPQDTRADLPFILAAPQALVLGRPTPFTRFSAIVNALEAALRFVVALELALLRESADETSRQEAANVAASYTDRPLALNTWEEVSVRLAALLPNPSNDAVVGALRGLVHNDGHRSGLSERLWEAIQELEQLIGPGITLADDAYLKQEKVFGSLLEDLLKLLAPLRHTRLVSVAEIESLEADDDSIRYALYSHQGATEHFPISHERLEARLTRDWCYLLMQGRTPLCLTPIVSARRCDSCGRVEVFLAEGIWLGPKGVEAHVRGVTSDHNASIRIPFDSRARTFFEATKAASSIHTTKIWSRGSPLTSSPPSAPVQPATAPVVPKAVPALPAAPSALPIPASLREALAAGRIIPFLGAGASMAVMDAERPGERLFPSWAALLDQAAQRLRAENLPGDAMAVQGFLLKKTPDFLEAARAARDGLGPTWYKVLSEVLDPPRRRAKEETLALPRAIWELGSQLVITTNYDRVLHWTCPEKDNLRSWDIEAPAELASLLRNGLSYPTIWHLHGTIANAANLILTPDGYSRLYPSTDAVGTHYKAALTSLRVLLASRTLLFVGFSFDDTLFGDQVRWVEETFQGAGGPHFVLVREAERDRMRTRLQGLPIELLTYAEHGEPLVACIRDLAYVSQQQPRP